ncbi:hypothetical protein CR513_51862, partial [Mucuna pruriens]
MTLRNTSSASTHLRRSGKPCLGFQYMVCINAQKVTIVAFMLAKQLRPRVGEFQEIFFKEVLSEDVRNYKGIEFLKLKQGNKIMKDYVAKLKNN